ncbi:hypothetical protein CC78DRAFT_530022 [Lojkania enalia]|uniref:Uncharacterized protein n=1 Tax=Lojkania enalia TaxID=147567 RepID=A0A9P4KJN6_9PLEO|nr:hypothetical protein CC78DRAFT_530022 [Didymosphaeria enalia]
MAIDDSITSLLTTLTASIRSAAEALPTDDITPPEDGISLLDVKNGLFLSYVQNIVFLILLKLRSRAESHDENDDAIDIQEEVVRKLVELRIYVERGVRPLETRLKYQIDKIIRAADDAARKTRQQSEDLNRSYRSKGSNVDKDDDSEGSDVESVGSKQTEDDLEDVSYGPNKANFVRSTLASNKKVKESSKDGIYRPPRIMPMTMPAIQGRDEKQSKKLGKSATLDEFVATELSTAPIAEPSIGSTIVSGGRRTKSERERREEAERREYEETNFVRLPKESKKERAKQRNRDRNGGWGGEEWRGLGAGLDRIEKLTQRKGGSLGSLEKSRKRPIEDGPRGTGSIAGEMFEKRRKVIPKYKK